MPTKREREYYRMGFSDGMRVGQGRAEYGIEASERAILSRLGDQDSRRFTSKPKRKLSAWQKYIKNKRNHIKYRDGKLNLKKMGVAFRRSKRR